MACGILGSPANFCNGCNRQRYYLIEYFKIVMFEAIYTLSVGTPTSREGGIEIFLRVSHALRVCGYSACLMVASVTILAQANFGHEGLQAISASQDSQ